MKVYKAGFDLKTNADEVTKEMDTMSEATDKAAKSMNNLDAKFEDVYGDIQPLTGRMGEAEDRLYELALAGDTATREYQELLDKVGQYRKVQIQTDLAVDAAATTMGQKLGGAIQAATSGFAAVQGTMGLVGVESEALEKTLLKVQAALAIQQGVQGIRESLPMLKQMGMAAKTAFSAMTAGAKAFAVTGIGVVLTAVAALAYALNELEEQEKRAEEERQKRHDDEMTRYNAEITKKRDVRTAVNEQLDAEQKAREQQVRLLQAQGKSITEAEWEVAQGYMETIQAKGNATAKAFNDLAEDNKRLRKEFASEYDLIDLSKEYQAKEKAAKKLMLAKIAANQAERKELKKQIAALRKLQEDGFDDMEVLDAAHQKRRQDNWKAYQDERLKAQRLITDLNLATEEEGERKDVLISNERFRRKIEDLEKTKFTAKEKARLENLYLVQQFDEEAKIRKKYRDERLKEETDAMKELQKQLAEITAKAREKEKSALDVIRTEQDEYFKRNFEANNTAYDVEKTRINNHYDELIRLAKKYGKDTFYIEKNRRAALDGLGAKWDKTELERKIELEQGIIEAAGATFQILGNLAQLFAGESEEQQRKAFKVQKAANIAQATIDTYASAVASYRSLAGIPVVGPVLGGVAAAAAVTAGLLNIKSISQQQFEGTTTENTDTYSNIGESGSISPEFNVVGDSGINQIAQLQQTPVQAYVVSGEVTTSQALDRNRVENATL